jgi:hypothetical protein
VTLAAVHGTPLSWLRLGDVVSLNRNYGWYTQSGQPAAGAAPGPGPRRGRDRQPSEVGRTNSSGTGAVRAVS